MGVSVKGGTQQPWVFLLKMIILGCEMGVPPFPENTHILARHAKFLERLGRVVEVVTWLEKQSSEIATESQAYLKGIVFFLKKSKTDLL